MYALRTLVVLVVAIVLSAQPSIAAYEEEGTASWYGPGFQGRKTASGEKYNMYGLTAAHKTLPLGTIVKVTNLKTGVAVCGVRINDRGPYHGGRIIDVSKTVAIKLGMIQKGTAKVRVVKTTARC